jgi:hypothetical protein
MDGISYPVIQDNLIVFLANGLMGGLWGQLVQVILSTGRVL